MIEPINIFRYVSKNYSYLKKNYNALNLIVSFFLVPLIVSFAIILSINETNISSIFANSLIFFSIIIGFLINVLVLIINRKDEHPNPKIDAKINKLKEHLGFNIINSIIFGLILVILILFYGNYDFVINYWGLNINLSGLLILTLSVHFVMLLLNILRKFGVYVETIANNRKKSD